MKLNTTPDGLIKIIVGMSTLFGTEVADPQIIFDAKAVGLVEEWLSIYYMTHDDAEVDIKNKIKIAPLTASQKEGILAKLEGELKTYIALSYHYTKPLSLPDLSVVTVNRSKPFILIKEDGNEKIVYLDDHPVYDFTSVMVGSPTSIPEPIVKR